MSTTQTHADLAATFARWTQPDLFGRKSRTGPDASPDAGPEASPDSPPEAGPDPEVEAARQRFHRRMARRRRKEAVAPYLAEPWRAWCEATEAARLARRFLARFPERDRPDPAYDLLTDRQAAAEYHWEEETVEGRNGDAGHGGRWADRHPAAYGGPDEDGADYGGAGYGERRR